VPHCFRGTTCRASDGWKKCRVQNLAFYIPDLWYQLQQQLNCSNWTKSWKPTMNILKTSIGTFEIAWLQSIIDRIHDTLNNFQDIFVSILKYTCFFGKCHYGFTVHCPHHPVFVARRVHGRP